MSKNHLEDILDKIRKESVNFTVIGGTEEQNKWISEILKETWPKVEPHYFKVFGEIMFRELAYGIQTTKEDLEKGVLEVMYRCGLKQREFDSPAEPNSTLKDGDSSGADDSPNKKTKKD